jgi:tetratricopeptide (TPR) repeat protein
MKLLWLALLLAVCSLAQVHQHAPPPTQSAVDLDKLPPPQRIEGIGHSHMEITTQSAQAQQWFDQGVSLMHCFWDYEALRAFEQSVRADPNCALCHWGIAQALGFRGGTPDSDQIKNELARAKELSANASEREQRIIRTFADANDKKGDEAANTLAKGLAALVDRYHGDVELQLLLSSAANSGYEEGEALPGAIYAQALLRDLINEHPDNAAAHHYWIHAVEASEHPEWALDSAAKLAALAPGSGHMVHMPGHIFYRVGDYERARQSFLASQRVDEAYMASQHVSVSDDWNYAHNLSYLVADCAEEGRYTEALEHARSLVGLADDPDHSGNPGFYVLQIASTEARLAIRFADWNRVIEHPLQFGVPDDKLNVWARGYRDGLVAYAKGMKAGEQNHLQDAEAESNALDALLWRLSQEKLDDKDKPRRDRVLKILGTAALELRGNLASYQGDLATARQLLQRADEEEKGLGYAEPPMYARPPMEVLGAAYLRAGQFEKAREAYNKALTKRPHSGFALYGIALSWEKQSDQQQATRAYREFSEAWTHADRDLPQMKAAQAYLQIGR